jgi:cytochrome c oxidase assembly factor CtaG
VVDTHQFVFDPEWAVAVVIAAVDYAVVARAHRRRGIPVPWYRWACFMSGLALISIALLSPVEHLALTSMLSFHLLQNVMLADWAPPLLVLGLTPEMLRGAERLRPVWIATMPAVALPAWLAVWYGVHVPAFYDYALRNRWALGIEHVLLLTAGILFWWAVISPGRLRPAGKLAFLAAAFFLAAPLSLLLALSQREVYSFYATTAKPWGVSALTDQQLGAIGMSVEQAIILFVACFIAFGRMLDDEGDLSLGQ